MKRVIKNQKKMKNTMYIVFGVFALALFIITRTDTIYANDGLNIDRTLDAIVLYGEVESLSGDEESLSEDEELLPGDEEHVDENQEEEVDDPEVKDEFQSNDEGGDTGDEHKSGDIEPVENQNNSTDGIQPEESTDDIQLEKNDENTFTQPIEPINDTIEQSVVIDDSVEKLTETLNESYQESDNFLVTYDTSSAELLDGMKFNAQIKMLSNSGNYASYTYDDYNITDIRRSSIPTLGLSGVISKSNSIPVFAWFDNGIIYYYTEATKIYFNSDSQYMFSKLKNLTNFDFGNYPDWDTSRVTNLQNMFTDDVLLINVILSGFNTSSVNYISYMFYGCTGLESLNMDNFDLRNVSIHQPSNAYNLFYGASNLKTLSLKNVKWPNDPGNLAYLSRLNNTKIEIIDATNWDFQNTTSVSNMFWGVKTLKEIKGINTWKNMGNITNMSSMFINCSSLVGLDLSNFDTSSVTSMNSMFFGCSSLTGLDLSSFDTSSVTDMSYMFDGCSSLTGLDLSSFDTSSVTNMSYMFDGCSSLTWLDLSSFDTSSVTKMSSMFEGVNKLNKIYVSENFTTSKVNNNNSSNMFSGAINLIGGNGTIYNSNNINKTYARIDTITSPGYFTSIYDKPYKITLELNGGEIIGEIKNEYSKNTIPRPINTGYTFVGWFYDSECLSSINDEFRFYDGIKLYAKWSKFDDLNLIFVTNTGEEIMYTMMDRNVGATEIYNQKYSTSEINTGSFGSYHSRGEIDSLMCHNGYYIPSINDWKTIVNERRNSQKKYKKNIGIEFSNDLLLPPAGYRNYGQGQYGDYWSSSPLSSDYSYYLNFSSTSINYQYSSTNSSKYTVRCIKTLPNPRNLNLHLNGGTTVVIAFTGNVGNGKFTALGTPENGLLNFEGWYSDSEYKNEVHTGDNVTTDLYAKWEELPKYTYNANNGVFDDGKYLNIIESKKNKNKIEISNNDYRYMLYDNVIKFTGANSLHLEGTFSPSCSNNGTNVYKYDRTKSDEGEVVSNVFSWLDFTFNFDVEGDVVTIETLGGNVNGIQNCPSLYYEGEATAIGLEEYTIDNFTEIPSRDGYEFSGRYEQGATEPFDFTGTEVTQDRTFYAKWIINSSTAQGEKTNNSSGGGRKGSSLESINTHGSADDKATDNVKDNNLENKNKNNNQGTSKNENTETDTSIKATANTSSQYTTEQTQSYQFAKSNGITTTSSIKEAKMDTSLKRIEMAKMLSYYAINVLGQEPDTSKGIVKFNDVSNKMDKQYNNGVTLSYQLGIMGQNMPKNNFRPNDEVTRAEFVTALSRMVYNTQDGKGNVKYYEPHMAKLYNEGIISNTDPKMKEKRGYVMTMLMRSAK